MDQSPYEPPHPPERPAKPAAVTPMMAQYFEIKAVNPGYMLFYRMGDFYELFFEDAETAAQALGIVLTKRGKHLGDDIPMCGVPIHAAQDYLKKLIGLGHRVAICEQVEDPAEARKRGAKSVVKRDVVRLVTPGTLTEDDLLPAKGNNFLASLASLKHGETDYALAWADISTGEVYVADIEGAALGDELARIEPAEIIVSPSTQLRLEDERRLGLEAASRLVPVSEQNFATEDAADRLRTAFAGLDATAFSRAARSALKGLVQYVDETQKGAGVPLSEPRLFAKNPFMQIDAATRQSLELILTNRGETAGSLRHAIDLTVTAAGARAFAQRLSAPLANAQDINTRLDMVEMGVEATPMRDKIRKALKAAPDIARALNRLSLERGGPRDLMAVGRGVAEAHAIRALLDEGLSAYSAERGATPEGFEDLRAALGGIDIALAEGLAAALVPEPPILTRDGGFVREGYDDALDKERLLAKQSRSVIAAHQAELATRTELKALKIKHNNVLGYFVEVPAAHGAKLMAPPHDDLFIHRQTLANAMRFTTAELAELEGRIARAHEAALALEREIFARLRADVLAVATPLRALALALGELDVSLALSTLGAERGYCRPQIDDSLAFAIEGGRHPVVERSLVQKGQSFVANGCDVSAPDDTGGSIWLITGPNMGGKSTFLRQNALIAIMAQMGSFVPAASAHLGIVDRLFSRVGAADDIAQGRSTFMVEMVETAAILNRATQKSLVVLDEIGRGTATFDGLSIAWATVEALHESNRCRALFATHFHELTRLGQALERLSNHTMTVREWKGEVVFLHEVANGAADRSYGIQVARLAGLPNEVVERAREVLDLLEQQSAKGPASMLDDLPLFAQRTSPSALTRSASSSPVSKPDPIAGLLDMANPDQMTPLQAIELIYELKKAYHGTG